MKRGSVCDWVNGCWSLFVCFRLFLEFHSLEGFWTFVGALENEFPYLFSKGQ